MSKFPELSDYGSLASPNPGDLITYRIASLPSPDLWAFQHPICVCCSPRVSLTDDRSEFTREAFGVI